MGKGMTWAERLTLLAYGLVMRALQPLLRRKPRRWARCYEGAAEATAARQMVAA